MKSALFLLFANILVVLASSKEEECFTIVQNGAISGLTINTLDPSRKVCAFLSIPYAQAPIGALRFMPPQPAQPWQHLNATTLPNWCPQDSVPPPGVQFSEDCLRLNVYKPKNISNANSTGLPVMVWIHGGSFTSGSSLPYTPTKLLAREDVILVVMHYRVGILGFFSTGDYLAPGNWGLKDQAFSIRWVHENIKAFGGNPDKVTVFGESAGGSSVIYQLISPLNKGLIHGVISQSGTALSSWSIDRNPSDSGKLIARRLGCPNTNSLEIINCMKLLPWGHIVKSQSAFTLETLQTFLNPASGLTPVVEPNLPGAFISEEPIALLEKGDVPDIPVLIGANKHDGSYIMGVMYLIKIGPENLDKDPNYMRQKIITDLLKFFNVHEDPSNRVVASSVELAYLDGVNRSSWNESMPGLVDFLTVAAYKSALQNTANHLAGRNSNVYVYSMDYHSNNSLWPLYFGADSNLPVVHDVTHGDELMYLFDFPATFSEQDKLFSDIICDMWLNFAKHGNPTPVIDNRYEQWVPYNATEEAFLKLDLNPKVEYGYRKSWRASSGAI